MEKDIRIETLTAHALEELMASRPEGPQGFAVSLWLGVRADRDFLSVANALFSEEAGRLDRISSLGAGEKAGIRAVFRRMEETLQVRGLPKQARTLVMFGDERGRERMHKLPVYVPSKLVVAPDWYIHPFIKEYDRFPRYAVLLLMRDRARLFELRWGEVEDEAATVISEVPQRMNPARSPNRGVDERKVRGHIEDHIHRHLKKVAGAAEAYLGERQLPYLVIGSRPELMARFEELLLPEVRKKVVGTYRTRTDPDLLGMKQRSLAVIVRFERRREAELIGKLRAGSSKRVRQAVLGLGDTLAAMNDYRVHELVLARDFTARGYACALDHCNLLRSDRCPVCGGPVTLVPDLMDEILESALRRGIRISHFLHPHPDFDSEGVGAILK